MAPEGWPIGLEPASTAELQETVVVRDPLEGVGVGDIDPKIAMDTERGIEEFVDQVRTLQLEGTLKDQKAVSKWVRDNVPKAFIYEVAKALKEEPK